MKHTNSFPGQYSGTGWQVFAELELPAGSVTPVACNDWLLQTLAPFNLNADFLRRVSSSAHEAIESVLNHEQALVEFEHIHLRVFVPEKESSQLCEGQTWGFFRIEKKEPSSARKLIPDHAIEFYLYVEG